MIAVEGLLDAFINANILFVLCYLLWFAVRAVLRGLGLSHTYGTQLRLLNVAFIAIVCSPIISLVFRSMQTSGYARGVNVNLSDAVVAYYLNGGFQMEASKFETLVLMRDQFTLNLLNADGLGAQALLVILALGSALGVLRLFMSVLSLRCIVRSSYAWRDFGRVQLRVSDRTLVPFSTRGWRTYFVVIPSHMLGNGREVSVALAHEFQHIRQGDLEWEILLEALKPIFFLNPAYRAWKSQVEHLRELNCDREVLSQGRIEVKAYCETLLSVCQQSLRKDRAFSLAVPKVTLVTADRFSLVDWNRGFLERRIHSALDGKRTRYQRLLFAAIAVPLLVAIAFATLAIQRPGDWSHDRLMLSTVVNLDRLDKINRLSTFGRLPN
ncbi:MAG: M56 family metallopeptidase [Pseudomonadota bacterium]